MNVTKILIASGYVLLLPCASLAGELFTFKGEVDIPKNEFSVILEINDNSSVAATAKKVSDTNYQFLLDVEHLKTPLFDLLSKIESSVEVIPENNDSKLSLADATFKGAVWSRYSLVDYKPVQELSGNFEIKNQRLHLSAISFGGLRCDGYIDLARPYNLNVVVDLHNVPMQDFLNFWGASKLYDSSGVVSGDIKISGTFDNLALKGNLQGRHGHVSKLNFDTISLNIEGIYPHMKISKSNISKSDGVSFTLDGPINLSDRPNFKKQIKALTLAPLVSDSGQEREWTFKRHNQEELGNFELKYRFRKGDALGTGTSVDDETDMFGIERTSKF